MRIEKTTKIYTNKKDIEIIGNFLNWLEEMENEEYDAISEVAETVNLYDAVSNIYKAIEEDPFE